MSVYIGYCFYLCGETAQAAGDVAERASETARHRSGHAISSRRPAESKEARRLSMRMVRSFSSISFWRFLTLSRSITTSSRNAASSPSVAFGSPLPRSIEPAPVSSQSTFKSGNILDSFTTVFFDIVLYPLHIALTLG